MTQHRIGLLTLLLIIPTSAVRAQGSNWMPITENGQYKISVDTSETMRQESSIATAWVKTEFAKAQRLSDNDARSFVSSVNRYKVDCDAGSESVGPGAFYDSRDLPLVAISSGYTPWQTPDPGTPAEQILKRICDVLRSRRH